MKDLIGYEALSRAAMRGVVREALRQGLDKGALPGDHHFYITFRTKAPGVEIAEHLVERFPEDMTIVIQHQYWDLEIHDAHFEVVLKFSGIPQHLRIPYSAITRFVDPSVNFGLSFEGDVRTEDKVIEPAADTRQDDGSGGDHPKADSDNTVISLDKFRRK